MRSRYTEANHKAKNELFISLESVKKFINGKIQCIKDIKDIEKIILSICTHKHTTFSFVKSHTSSASKLINSLDIADNEKNKILNTKLNNMYLKKMVYEVNVVNNPDNEINNSHSMQQAVQNQNFKDLDVILRELGGINIKN